MYGYNPIRFSFYSNLFPGSLRVFFFLFSHIIIIIRIYRRVCGETFIFKSLPLIDAILCGNFSRLLVASLSSLTCISLRIVCSSFYYTLRHSRLVVITTWLFLPCTLLFTFSVCTPTAQVHVYTSTVYTIILQFKIVFAICVCKQ